MVRTLSISLLGLLLSISADAGVIFVFSTADAGFSALPVHEDFESISPKDASLPSFSSNGIDYVAISPPQNVFVSSAGYTNYGIPVTTSSILTTNGNENFEIRPNFVVRRMGFDVYTINDPDNPFSVVGARNVEVSVRTATEIAILSLSPPVGNFGFLGIVSDDPILTVEWLADLGGIRNTGIDNIRVSASAAAAPEPSSLALLALGLALGLGRARLSRR